MRDPRTTALLLIAAAAAVGVTFAAARPVPRTAAADLGRLVVFETFNRPG